MAEVQRMTIEQVNILKKNIDEMSRSEEQFIFMIFKNLDGTDNITQFSWNMVPEKIEHYLREAINSAIIKEEGTID